jgi:antitoxin component YwqK of YwqJK toxin-antitoxin module
MERTEYADRVEYKLNGKLHREDGPAIEIADETKYWYRDGKFHREDGPAMELADGTKKWYLDGKLHREDGPAVEYASGTKYWYRDGKLHREDGPAIEYSYGTKKWYLDGKLHREDGPAMELADGTKEWYLDGKCHREDGPSVEEANGSNYWYINDMLHREDGPAMELADGTKKWYLDGKLHREDGPAMELADGTKCWYRDGAPSVGVAPSVGMTLGKYVDALLAMESKMTNEGSTVFLRKKPYPTIPPDLGGTPTVIGTPTAGASTSTTSSGTSGAPSSAPTGKKAAVAWSTVVRSGLQAAVQLIPDQLERFAGAVDESIEGVVLADQLDKARAFLDDLDVLLAGGMEWSTFCEGVRGLFWCAMFIVEQAEEILDRPPQDGGDEDMDHDSEFMELMHRYRHVSELLLKCSQDVASV